MIKTLHLISATFLLISHATFFLRGIYISRKKIKPATIDYLSRLLAQLTLGTTIITGLILWPIEQINFFPHILLGLLPLIAIPIVFFIRIITRKKRALPWLLPLLNLLFIIGALITGTLYGLHLLK